jgi:hypothetical protein
MPKEEIKRMAEKKNPKPKEKPIRIIWDPGDDLPVLYANQLFVSHAGDTEFHLVFGHLFPPLTMGLEEAELPDRVRIKPVAKIVISPEAMKAFSEVLVKNYQIYAKNHKDNKNA